MKNNTYKNIDETIKKHCDCVRYKLLQISYIDSTVNYIIK